MRAVHVLQLAALTWVVRAVALNARLYLIGGLDGVTDNPTTTVRYQVPEDARVVIRVYDLLGRVVTTLVDAQVSAGFYHRVWDGRNDAGLRVASGVYIYRMEAGTFVQTRKMLLLK